MKRVFLSVFAFVLVLSLAVLSTTTVSASPTQHLQSAGTQPCPSFRRIAAQAGIFDQGTGVGIGYAYVWVDGCGQAEGECSALSVYGGVVNHGEMTYEIYRPDGSGSGGVYGDYHGSSDVWTAIVDSEAGAGSYIGVASMWCVVQAISHNYWGQASTPNGAF